MVGGISAVNPYVGQYVGYVRARAALQGAGGAQAVSQSAYGQPVQGVGNVGAVSAVSGAWAGSGVGVVSGVLAGRQIGAVAAGRGANPGAPVEPVSTVSPVSTDAANGVAYTIPFLRKGMDPAELAVRMRIQYVDLSGTGSGKAGAAKEIGLSENGDDLGIDGTQKVTEETECQTCKERKYQDGSDDAGVSYKTPTHISPDQAASAVRGHEMEHVVRERAAAQRENRRVVSQSVTMHTAICPECGRVYVSGGTTRTTTASDPQPEQTAKQQAGDTFSAAA